MHDFVKNFKDLVKGDSVSTDNNVFRLHYKFSVILLIIFSILLSSKQYFGDPIDCDGGREKVETVNVYCWITGTFILKTNVEATSNLDSLEGLGNEKASRGDSFSLLYYQWICILFVLQALFFYVPRFFWNIWENDRLNMLIKDLRGPLVCSNWTDTYRKQLSKYILDPGNHDILAYRFAFCEVLNLCNLIFQIQFMDWYLNGSFATYGYDVLTKPWSFTAKQLFPRRTKCIYTNYGASGSAQSMDVLCVLPLNILNEKFFLILWFWLGFLFIVTVLALIYRGLFMFWQKFRIYLLMAQARGLNRKKAIVIGQFLSHGQFFLLYTMGKKLNPIIYEELLLTIYSEIGNNHKLDNISNV